MYKHCVQIINFYLVFNVMLKTLNANSLGKPFIIVLKDNALYYATNQKHQQDLQEPIHEP